MYMLRTYSYLATVQPTFRQMNATMISHTGDKFQHKFHFCARTHPAESINRSVGICSQRMKHPYEYLPTYRY